MAQNQVRGMMNRGCDLPSSERSIRLGGAVRWIWAAVGSHPDDADQVDEARILMYRKLARHSRVKAIGEIGLDYHYEDIPRDVQQHAPFGCKWRWRRSWSCRSSSTSARRMAMR